MECDSAHNVDTDQNVEKASAIGETPVLESPALTNLDRVKPQFTPLWAIPFGYTNFGESLRNLNKQLISDIENEKEHNPSEKRTFAKNDCGWQSSLRMENKYESFEELRKLIHLYSLGTIHASGVSRDVSISVGSLWANMIFARGGWSNPHIHGSGDTIWSGVYYPKGITEVENLDEFIPQEYLTHGINHTGGSLIIKDLTVNDQKFINNFLIARPEIKEVTIHSISLEGDLEKRLSRESVKWTFMGPKRYCMEKKMKVRNSPKII